MPRRGTLNAKKYGKNRATRRKGVGKSRATRRKGVGKSRATRRKEVVKKRDTKTGKPNWIEFVGNIHKEKKKNDKNWTFKDSLQTAKKLWGREKKMYGGENFDDNKNDEPMEVKEKQVEEPVEEKPVEEEPVEEEPVEVVEKQVEEPVEVVEKQVEEPVEEKPVD
jgi:hypothetical protein